jgi:hypothetical protein
MLLTRAFLLSEREQYSARMQKDFPDLYNDLQDWTRWDGFRAEDRETDRCELWREISEGITKNMRMEKKPRPVGSVREALEKSNDRDRTFFSILLHRAVDPSCPGFNRSNRDPLESTLWALWRYSVFEQLTAGALRLEDEDEEAENELELLEDFLETRKEWVYEMRLKTENFIKVCREDAASRGGYHQQR